MQQIFSSLGTWYTGKFSVKSHTVMQTVFTGHDQLKRSNRYSNQAGVSTLSFTTLLTYLSEEHSKILRVLEHIRVCKVLPFSRDYEQQNREVKKIHFFCRNCNQSSPCVRKLLIEKFSGTSENFSGNLVAGFRYFLQLCYYE